MEKVDTFFTLWNILRPFGNLVAIWYHFPRFGILCQEKFSNHVYNAINSLVRFEREKFYHYVQNLILRGAVDPQW
jgi:hypothetical protein